MNLMRDWQTNGNGHRGGKPERQPEKPSGPAWLARWTSWARRIRGRHERIVRHAAGLRFILARAGGGMVRQINQWRRNVFATYPTIRLSIGPLIFQPDERAARWPLPPGASMRFALPDLSAGSKEIEVVQAIDQGNRREGSAGASADDRRFVTAGGEERSAGLLNTPIGRVFARASVGGTESDSRLTRHETISLQQSLKLEKQTERRRVEEIRRHLNLTLSRHELVTRTINKVQQETVIESPHVLQARSRGIARGSEFGAAFDLDQLTDSVVRNIDRRIIAHRERMRRVF
jgi:hypothetical protein